MFNTRRRIVLLSVVSISVLALILFCYSFFIIHKDVKTICLKAQNEYGQDCADSLILYIQSDNNPFRGRNSAVWVLGQLADKKALPFLYELKKSLPEQEKCSYNDFLCKYEVQKAIKWCEKGNATNWMYRNRDNWR